MLRLDLATAARIVEATLTEARARALPPMTVAVLDAGSHLIAFAREDGASLFRPQIAIGKASGALGMGCSTRVMAERAHKVPMFYQGLMALTGEILPSPGGLLIKAEDESVLGAVGVSGDSGDNDEAIAEGAILSVSNHHHSD